jgi:hypothetical protein
MTLQMRLEVREGWPIEWVKRTPSLQCGENWWDVKRPEYFQFYMQRERSDTGKWALLKGLDDNAGLSLMPPIATVFEKGTRFVLVFAYDPHGGPAREGSVATFRFSDYAPVELKVPTMNANVVLHRRK